MIPRRWVDERTFYWLVQNRHWSEDCERLCATSEALILATALVYGPMSRLVVRRLAPGPVALLRAPRRPR